MKSRFVLKRSLLALLVAATFASAHAAKLEESVSKAVLGNPDVLAKWHQFRASGAERNISWGRYLPTLDYLLGAGDQSFSSPAINPARDQSIASQKITVRQNLYEGFATRNDVARLDHAHLMRYYELLDSSENAAAEAARAYIDTYRYRKLLEMAEDNYATHRLVFDKIGARARSGVGRGVDLEMAAARLALAESNLLVEASNLHDVNARYQRIVGESATGEIDPPPTNLAKGLPKTRRDAVVNGFQNSPQLKAAVENIRSARRNVEVQRGGYFPRVDVYAESARDKNVGGVPGDTDTNTIGVTLTWNLFRGLQDDARAAKATAEAEAARDLRERVCRDLRQNLAMAYNDHLRLSEQLPFLDQHQLSTDKAREALRKQFDIGQRTLLDLLDIENEYYTARRNYLNGELDDVIAQIRYLAASGSLLKTLKVRHLDVDQPGADAAAAAGAEAAVGDYAGQCPPEPAAYPAFDKNAVLDRAREKEYLLRSSAARGGDKGDAAPGFQPIPRDTPKSPRKRP